MTRDQALQKVKDFLIEKGYDGELLINVIYLGPDGDMDVELLKPNGLFIVHPDGSVEDNYQVFGEE